MLTFFPSPLLYPFLRSTHLRKATVCKEKEIREFLSLFANGSKLQVPFPLSRYGNIWCSLVEFRFSARNCSFPARFLPRRFVFWSGGKLSWLIHKFHNKKKQIFRRQILFLRGVLIIPPVVEVMIINQCTNGGIQTVPAFAITRSFRTSVAPRRLLNEQSHSLPQPPYSFLEDRHMPALTAVYP